VADDDLLTLPDIAELLRMNPSTIRSWVTQERLPAQRSQGETGRWQWLVRRGDLEQMLDAHPHIGRPRNPERKAAARATEHPSDWSDEPRRSMEYLASSIPTRNNT
jgi:hypothetical protein